MYLITISFVHFCMISSCATFIRLIQMIYKFLTGYKHSYSNSFLKHQVSRDSIQLPRSFSCSSADIWRWDPLTRLQSASWAPQRWEVLLPGARSHEASASAGKSCWISSFETSVMQWMIREWHQASGNADSILTHTPWAHLNLFNKHLWAIASWINHGDGNRK